MIHFESIRIPIDVFPIFSRFSILFLWHSFAFRVVRAREYVAYDAASTYLETRQSGAEVLRFTSETCNIRQKADMS